MGGHWLEEIQISVSSFHLAEGLLSGLSFLSTNTLGPRLRGRGKACPEVSPPLPSKQGTELRRKQRRRDTRLLLTPCLPSSRLVSGPLQNLHGGLGKAKRHFQSLFPVKRPRASSLQVQAENHLQLLYSLILPWRISQPRALLRSLMRVGGQRSNGDPGSERSTPLR